MSSLWRSAWVLCLVSSALSSCGVMFGGSRFNGSIVVKNHPTAKIYVNGNHIGTGAAVQNFPRNQPLVVQVRQEGCDPQTRTFNKTFRTGNFVLSVFTWGLVGALVDIGSGAAYKPDHLHDPSITKMGMKNFVFNVDYNECPD